MMEREYFQTQAKDMAHILADHLLQTKELSDKALAQAAELIKDCVWYLEQSALAVKLALDLHPLVERRAKWSGWATALDTILRNFDQDEADVNYIRLLHNRSQVARELGDYAKAAETARDALHISESQNNPALIATSLNKLGLVQFEQDNLSNARDYLEAAYGLGRGFCSDLELGHICMNLGYILGHQRQFEDAHHYFDQALMYYNTYGDQLHVAKVYCNVANLLQRAGHLEKVPSMLVVALNTFEELGARYEYAQAKNDLGYVLLQLEQFEQARQAFELALKIFDELGVISSKALVLSNLAEMYVSTRQWDKAQVALDGARELAVVCHKPLLVAAINVDQGRMLLAQGDYLCARQIWEEAYATQLAKGARTAAQQTQHLLLLMKGDSAT